MITRSTAAVLAMINQATDIELDLTKIQLGEPIDIEGEEGARANTRMTLIPLPATGMTGTVTIEYNRVNLSEIAMDLPDTFLWEDQTTVGEFLDAINGRYGLRIEPDEIANGDEELGAADIKGQVPFTVKAASDSLAWRGEVTLKLQRRTLADVILVNVLDGLKYYPPVP